jgi:hypothetical protein
MLRSALIGTALVVASLVVMAASLTVAPYQATLAIGQHVQLTVSGGNGSSHWSSSAPLIASVSSTGLVNGVSAGTAVISVRRGPSTAKSTITVTPTAPAPEPPDPTPVPPNPIPIPPPTNGVITVPTCQLADVQAAINAAPDGTKVQLPAGTCVWPTNVGWGDKNITVAGAGIDRTTISGSDQYIWYIGANATGKARFRLTGMTLTGNVTNAAIAITTEGNPGVNSGWRIDHIKFNFPTGQRRGVTIRGATYGLIDHNDYQWSQGVAVGISAFNASDACVSPMTNAQGNFVSSQPLDLGTANAVYIEDNTFTSSGTGGNIVYDDSAGGGRMVFRHNTVTGGYVYSHWTRGCEIGGFIHEIYQNTFIGNADYNDYPVRLESGTGVIFSNTMRSYQTFPPYVVFDDRRAGGTGEASLPSGACDGKQPHDGNLGDPNAPGWPCLGQIGRSPGTSLTAIIAGTKQASAPFYLWNNGIELTCASGGDCTDVVAVWATPAAYVKASPHPNGDVDYVLNGKTPKPGYTPFVYPHPLVQP